MKLIRIILFPITPIYFLVTWLRNWLYDVGLKTSKSFDFPVICVGNLSTGGTGKSPMIEYLIRLLKDSKSVATLSRGYKRHTEGFILADDTASAESLGDEPFQFYTKFEGIKVAVDTNRQNGIKMLRTLEDKPEVILLDDAYQHRKVKAGFNILLTAYNQLFCNDIVLPTGNLREPRSGAKRAHAIVVTKCPENLKAEEKENIIKRLRIRDTQQVYFSTIDYSEIVKSLKKELELKSLPRFTLVTGIANAKPMVNYLSSLGLKFDHLEFPDHYSFKSSDVEIFKSKTLILTTEKDYVRLSVNEDLKEKLYYLPIKIILDKEAEFKAMIENFVA
ncbi:tetraacyldisaccharide 4'-kinase [Winogradskyella sp.]|uniref:tetraacyldisaccharide 4'-kinase n=1 Tax=Winogradskyella sp. TaxID=1883156 RepID=UPI003F6C4F22